MPPRKRAQSGAGDANGEPVAKRRSARQSAAASTVALEPEKTSTPKSAQKTPSKTKAAVKTAGNKKTAAADKPAKSEVKPTPAKATTKQKSAAKAAAADKISSAEVKAPTDSADRAASEDPDIDSIPTRNPEAPKHDGEWYWLMKAEPETRFENGIDVRFSIDDLRAKTKPEGWDGIRAYAARNHMRNMNAGDMAFFYHSNCKEPCIAGTMEIVKEFSEDKSARRPGTPYYDPQSTKDKPRWSLVHVEFRKKFAVPITLKELRELGKPGGPLENMQMLKQSRLSVSRVGADEWKALCKIADEKAEEAGQKHETGKAKK